MKAKHEDYAAGQARYRIGQHVYQMGQVKFKVDQTIQQIDGDIGGYDRRLGSNPCVDHPSIDGCDGLTKEQLRYAAARNKVMGNRTRLAADMQANEAALAALAKDAEN